MRCIDALDAIEVDVELLLLDDSRANQYGVAADLIAEEQPTEYGADNDSERERNAADDEFGYEVLFADTDVYEQRRDGLPGILRDQADDLAYEEQDGER